MLWWTSGWRNAMETSEPVLNSPTRILRLRVRGFRSYGSEVREIEMAPTITVIRGENSQGKTATAEAVEFLFTGLISRRSLFGGAKSEYERILKNVHLPSEDPDVWVEADIRCPDGVERTIRRTLTADYSTTTDCASTITIDSHQVSDLDSLGIPLGDPPLAAPVLLQHNLRYVLSTAPQQRAAYFRALLELTDLDQVREAIARAKGRVADLPPLPWMVRLAELRDSAWAEPVASSAIDRVEKSISRHTMTAELISVAKAVSPSVRGETAEAVIGELRAAKQRAEEKVFPIGALTPTTSNMPTRVDHTPLARSVDVYADRLRGVDLDVARLAPIFEAVVSHPQLGSLSEPAECPVCEQGTLEPDRIQRLREQLAASKDVRAAASGVAHQLQAILGSVEATGRAMRAVLPEAHEWADEWKDVAAHHASLVEKVPAGTSDLSSGDSARGAISRAGYQLERLRELWHPVKTVVASTNAKVQERAPIRDELVALLSEVNECVDSFRIEIENLAASVDRLSEELGGKLHLAHLPPGLREVLDLLEHRDDLQRELEATRKREEVRQRVQAIDRLIQTAEGALLDERFDMMGAEIDRWWATLRPDELVRFGGVGRRASGRRYVDLTAELASTTDALPEVRNAVGVFSDSQLNALGLAAFLARQCLIGSPFVILDDPLPGYDPEHRLTFAVGTLSALLDEGIQVIVCTHDPKLALNTVDVHRHRGLEHYELSLSNMAEGTAVTNETDVFGQHILAAQDAIASSSVDGRRNAANALRRAAERLAKQIIATGRTQEGTPTRVSEVDDNVLSKLAVDALGFALDASERGRWETWRKNLNPAAHDDADVPQPPTLKTIMKEIKKLKNAHEKHWPGGLLK
ncbi:AAA family ATPase [Aeromicrobium senzhongii]